MLKPRDSFAKEYHLKKCIDVKGLAEVWEVASVKTHIVNSVALKIFPWVRTAGIKEIEAGFTKQPYFEHSNLLSAKRLGIYDNRPYLEMHFCDNGNISRKVLQLSENEIAKCMHQISSALAYLHENSVIHGCVKPANILIDGNSYYLYLADLGLGRELRETIERFVEVDADEMISHGFDPAASTGPARLILPCFSAPELFENNPIATSAADIWAFGASIFEMITGKLPFGYLGGEAQRKNNAVLKDIQQTFSVDLNYIIKKCLSKNKEDRPTAQEIEEWTNNFLKGRKPVFSTEVLKPANNVQPQKTVTAFNLQKTAADNGPAKPIITFETTNPLDIVEQVKPTITVEAPKFNVNVEPTAPITAFELPKPLDIVEQVKTTITVEDPKSNVNVEPTALITAFEPPKLNIYIETKKPITESEFIKSNIYILPLQPSVDIEPQKPIINIETKELINAVTHQTPSFDIELTKPIPKIEHIKHTINVEPSKIITGSKPTEPITIIEPINPIEIIEVTRSKNNIEPIKPDIIDEQIKPIFNTEPITFAVADEPIKPSVDVEPLKPVFFADARPAVVTIKNVPERKPFKWKTALNFVLPSLVVGIILFAYIQLSSNSPEYTIIPAPKYTITHPLNTTKDSSPTINKQLGITSSKAVVPNSRIVIKKLPVAVKKPIKLIAAPANSPMLVPKATQNKPVVQSNGLKALGKQTVVAPKTKKQKDVEKVIDHGIPKHKDEEQTVDLGVPKHKDREQKNK